MFKVEFYKRSRKAGEDYWVVMNTRMGRKMLNHHIKTWCILIVG